MAGQNANATLTSLLGTQSGLYSDLKIQRSDFPQDFIFGAATSAYQVEGAWATAGKGPSNWDVFTQRTPGMVEGGTNGNVAINQYNLLKEDVKIIKKIGFDSYRISISWTRVLPGGRLSGGVNRDGIQYYNDLIDLLLLEGITPCVTIFHWDLPQCLQDEYGGFLSPQIVQDYCEFAELCFWEFGDRVKHWITLNEPWSYTLGGYVNGTFPPARGGTSVLSANSGAIHRYRTRARGVGVRSAPAAGDSGTEPYTVAHYLILSHAAAVDIYRKKYQAHQGGKIGMTNVGAWYEPYDADSEDDKKAAVRSLEFMLGWFVAPLVTGDYPLVMRQEAEARLPTFTQEEVKLVKGSYDFLGINYYTANYVMNVAKRIDGTPSYENDLHAQTSTTGTNSEGQSIGPAPGSDWLFIVPYGIHRLLISVKDAYGNPPVFVTENGMDEISNVDLTVTQARIDPLRIQYHNDHLFYVKKAMDEGANIQAYFAWAMFDNFEWAEGYSVRFGLVYINYVNGNLTRTPKDSAIWFMNFLNTKPVLLKRQAQQNEEEYSSVKRLRST